MSQASPARHEIYVQKFPLSPSKWQISNNGGFAVPPKELFYIGADKQMTSVAVNTLRGFEAGTPGRLFEVPSHFTFFDVAPDGQKFGPPVPVKETAAPIQVVLNRTAGGQR